VFIPGIRVTTAMYIVNESGRFEITSVENVKGRGMYVEALAKEVKPRAKCDIKMPEDFLLKLARPATRPTKSQAKPSKPEAQSSPIRLGNLESVIGQIQDRIQVHGSACGGAWRVKTESQP
jgi:hypothetical protein